MAIKHVWPCMDDKNMACMDDWPIKHADFPLNAIDSAIHIHSPKISQRPRRPEATPEVLNQGVVEDQVVTVLFFPEVLGSRWAVF